MGVALSGFLYLCRQLTERQPKFAQIIPLQWCPLTCTDADICVKRSRTNNYHVPRLQSLAIACLGTWSYFLRKVGEKGEIRGREKMKWILPFSSLRCHHTLIALYHSLGFFLPISYFLFPSYFLKSWIKRLLFKPWVYLEHPKKPLTTHAISLSCSWRFVMELNIRSKNQQKYWCLSSYHM